MSFNSILLTLIVCFSASQNDNSFNLRGSSPSKALWSPEEEEINSEDIDNIIQQHSRNGSNNPQTFPNIENGFFNQIRGDSRRLSTQNPIVSPSNTAGSVEELDLQSRAFIDTDEQNRSNSQFQFSAVQEAKTTGKCVRKYKSYKARPWKALPFPKKIIQ